MPKTALPPPISMAWLTRLPDLPPEHKDPSLSTSARVQPTRPGSGSEHLPASHSTHQPAPLPGGTVKAATTPTPPAIDEADRALLDNESLTRAAMVLDIISSKTATLAGGPPILDELSGALIEVARVCQLNDQSAEHLLRTVRGDEGARREVLSRNMQSCQNKIHPSSDATALWEPKDVQHALRQIETLTQLVIRETTLILDAESLIDYRKV